MVKGRQAVVGVEFSRRVKTPPEVALQVMHDHLGHLALNPDDLWVSHHVRVGQNWRVWVETELFDDISYEVSYDRETCDITIETRRVISTTSYSYIGP